MALELQAFETTSSEAHQSASTELPAPDPQRRRGPSWPMLWTVAAIPLIACALSFPIIKSHWFRRSADPSWVQASSMLYVSHNAPCEVVLYGDSTAITGLDPDAIQAATHLRTCNIAQTKGALVVLGTSALDIYLAHNPRPRYLLFQFSAADFYKPTHWSDSYSYMEGAIDLLRFYPATEFAHQLLRHPELFIGAMHYAYVSGPVHYWQNRHRPNALLDLNASPLNVHFIRDYPAYDNCTEVVDADPLFHSPDPHFIQMLRQHYSRFAEHVLIDVAPSSACDPHSADLAHSLAGVDNSLQQYPASLFNEGYTHYTKQGSAMISQQVAAQIESLETTNPELPRQPSRQSHPPANLKD
jgi:hypothetical protein